MIQEVGEIIQDLHAGRRSSLDLRIEDLKLRSLFLDEQTQQDVLIFAEQVQFQYEYDPWHNITPEIRRAADKLLRDLS